MADINHYFLINAPPQKVFPAISTPAGLDVWWTKTSTGKAELNAQFELGFGPGNDWQAKVSKCVPDREFELELTSAHGDWQGSRVGFLLKEKDDITDVRFYHLGWPQENEHYYISCYCWAMYLRLLKRNVEHDEFVPYEDRLEV